MLLQAQTVGPANVLEGNLFVNVPWNIATPAGLVSTASLTPTVNVTISVPGVLPPTPSICIIQPPVTNLQAWTLKGVAGDTGILQLAALPVVLSLGTGFVSFVINLAAGSNQLFTFTWL
jgi:hypothetical protein